MGNEAINLIKDTALRCFVGAGNTQECKGYRGERLQRGSLYNCGPHISGLYLYNHPGVSRAGEEIFLLQQLRGYKYGNHQSRKFA